MPLGEIPGISVGDTFPRRRDMLNNGLHRNQMLGIVSERIVVDGQAIAVAESIVLSDGYVDDLDFGDLIIYTGQGGRNRATGIQVENQVWTIRGNAALKNSHTYNHIDSVVVRVIKKRKVVGNNYFFEYSGLYKVSDAWSDVGKHGFDICRFLLVKVEMMGKLGGMRKRVFLRIIE